MVSIETVMPAAVSAATTGSTRCCSTSGLTRSAPGRVDSPPTSTTLAPCATMRSACRRAMAGFTKRPPSLNESGVTFRMPHTAGAGRLTPRPAQSAP